MDDCVLVLNAGSSRLKFCVYCRRQQGEWRAESRGQIEAIGNSASLTAKDAGGTVLIDEKLGASVGDGRIALDALAQWLRSQYGSS